jgi:hypothetical protein
MVSEFVVLNRELNGLPRSITPRVGPDTVSKIGTLNLLRCWHLLGIRAQYGNYDL